MIELTDSEAGFTLDPRLTADCLTVAELGLSRVLLLNDSRYPWLVLVPRRAGVTEIHHLSAEDQTILWGEIIRVSKLLETEFKPKKMNVGALGNIVSQLHIHIIARNEDDPAWPGPVWGHSTATPYSENESEKLITSLNVKLV